MHEEEVIKARKNGIYCMKQEGVSGYLGEASLGTVIQTDMVFSCWQARYLNMAFLQGTLTVLYSFDESYSIFKYNNRILEHLHPDNIVLLLYLIL